MMLLKNEIIPGFNTYFTSNSDNRFELLASLLDEESGRKVDVYSDMPGIQVYTGDYLFEPFYPFAGVALEAQLYPDTPTHPSFPSCIVEQNKEVQHSIKFCFSIE